MSESRLELARHVFVEATRGRRTLFVLLELTRHVSFKATQGRRKLVVSRLDFASHVFVKILVILSSPMFLASVVS